jgi:hypothetical protein
MSDEQLREFRRVYGMVLCGFIGASLIFGCVLLYKCYQKRRSAENIKTQMSARKQMYASNLGLNLYELNNDPRLTFTMHV